MINIEDYELITEAEWYKRLIEDKEYVTISFDWEGGVTRIFEKDTGKIFDVTCENVGNRRMLRVKEVY